MIRNNFKRAFLLFFLLSLPFLFCFCQNKSHEIYIASWNLENLFDTIDDPNKFDEDFTPDGRMEWTEERLEQKFKNLSKVIRFMNSNRGPDLLGVQEVENEGLLLNLAKNYLAGKNYSLTYAESLDGRGIDVGLLYNEDIFDLVSYDTLLVPMGSDRPTRYILYSELNYGKEKTIHVFVNHWSSRRGGTEKTEPKRIKAAEVLRDYIEEILLKDSESKIIVMGDFNDVPDNNSIYTSLNAKEFNCNQNNELGGSALSNLSHSTFQSGKGTYLYRGNWNMLDQIIVSNSVLEDNKFNYLCDSFEIIKPDFMVIKEGEYKGAALRTYGGGKYLGGYSDHYPVGAKFLIIN